MAMKTASMCNSQSLSVCNIYNHEGLLVKNRNSATLNIKKGANYI